MHDEPRTTDQLPVNPAEQPDEPVIPPKAKDHVLAGWRAADPDAFRPAGVEHGDDDLPIDPEDEDFRHRL